jgi:hypothetical protein
MSVWLTIPSARPAEEAEKCLAKWRQQGYKIALLIDASDKWRTGDPYEFLVMRPRDVASGAVIGKHFDGSDANLLIMAQRYPGYAVAVNHLIAEVMLKDPDAEWFVIGGDDVEPDMNHTAEEIAQECVDHFEDWNGGYAKSETFGVMQPTGDRFANGSIDRICGSAWIGREFARLMYRGNGPLWPEYTRFFMDEELQAVAMQYGVFQQRRDLIHLHRHYMRESDALDAGAVRTEIPQHLLHQEARWIAEQEIFNKRKHARPTAWPGSEPIA